MEKIYFGLIILFHIHGTISTKHCSVRKENGFVKADCQRLNLTQIPTAWYLNETIQILDLSENNLTTIPNRSLVTYRNLLTLNLNQNEITTIQVESFSGLEKLQNLSLSKNFLNISRVSGTLLKQIMNVTNFDISDNCSPQSIFGTNLAQLYLEYPDQDFKRLTQLKSLSIDLYGYPVFGPGFKKLPLQSLNFNQCYIRNLLNDTFKNFPDSVKKIQLSSCEIINVKSIQNGFFNPFPSVTWLDMSRTSITITKAIGLLYPLRNKSMEMINFGHMSNSWLPDRISVPFAITLTKSMMENLNSICVKTLILAENNIVDVLPKSLFASDYLHCMEHIDLSGNRFGLSALFPEELQLSSKNLTNLRMFDFSYLPLRYIDAKFLPFSKNYNITPTTPHDSERGSKSDCRDILFRHTANVTITLPGKLEYIRITHVLGAPPLKHLTLVNISHLKYVDMSYYRMTCFPNIYIDENENNLEYLDISGIDCKLYYDKPSIPLFRKLKTMLMNNVRFYQAVEKNANIFKFIPNLENLHLSENDMFKLPEDFFIKLKKLVTLRLSRNHFRYLPSGLLMLEKLVSLDMTDNRLFTIFPNFTNWLDTQQVRYDRFYLAVNYNDFSCTCRNTDFVRWLNSTKVEFDKKGDYGCRLINGTTIMTDEAFENFHELFADCYAYSWLRVGIAVIVSFFCVLLPVAVVLNFRWRILFYCFRKCRNIVELSMNLSYEYDVYVAYGYNGYPWVKTFLVKHLEDKWGLRTCIEDRDFILGKSNYDQIANAIEKSRHLIFVVTSDFISKPFAIYEIDRAKEAKTSRTLQNIIIVTLDVNIECIPTELQSIWSDVFVIEWPDRGEETESVINNLRTRLLLNF